MKVKYFQDTDTVYIEFRANEVAETRDLDEDTLLVPGRVFSMSVDQDVGVDGDQEPRPS